LKRPETRVIAFEVNFRIGIQAHRSFPKLAHDRFIDVSEKNRAQSHFLVGRNAKFGRTTTRLKRATMMIFKRTKKNEIGIRTFFGPLAFA